MWAANARFVLVNDLLRRRHYPYHLIPAAPRCSFLVLRVQNTPEVLTVVPVNMPNKAKKSAKRDARKRAEEAQNGAASKALQSAYAESVTDEETTRKDAKSETDEKESKKNADIDAFLRTVPIGPSNVVGPSNAGPSSGADTQHQSNRVAATKDSSCPNHTIYDEVMKGLEKMSEEEVDRLRNVLLEHANKEGFPIELPALPSRYVSVPSNQLLVVNQHVRSIRKPPSWTTKLIKHDRPRTQVRKERTATPCRLL